MTLETIIKLFRQAGASKLYYTDPEAAQRVAQMIAEAEREACAKVCDRVGYHHEVQQGAELAFDLAAAIRARGQA